MLVKNVVRANPTDQPAVELSEVKDGDQFNVSALLTAIQQAGNPVQGVSYDHGITVETVKPDNSTPTSQQ